MTMVPEDRTTSIFQGLTCLYVLRMLVVVREVKSYKILLKYFKWNHWLSPLDWGVLLPHLAPEVELRGR